MMHGHAEETLLKSNAAPRELGLLGLTDEEQQDFFQYLIETVIETGAQPGEVAQISAETQQAYCALAYDLYERGQYAEAAKIFGFLVMAFPRHSQYCKGIGACYQMLQNYTKACEAYLFATWLEPMDAVAYFHLGECCVQLNQIEHARACFQMVGVIADEDSDHEIHREYGLRAQALLDRLRYIKQGYLKRSGQPKTRKTKKK